MSVHETLRRPAQVYVASVVVAGSVVATHSLIALIATPVRPSWFVLAVLTLLSGSFTVRIPGIPARLSVSETFVFAAVLMFGPAAATVIVVLDSLVISFWLGRRSNPASRLFFNVSAPSIAIWTSSHLFYYVTGIAPLSIAPQPVVSLIFPLLGLAVLYFLLNSWLVAFAVAFQKRLSAVSIWRQNLLWLSLNYFTGASVAALVLPYLLQLEYAFIRIVGILLPILTASYLTLKTALGRVEDANKHVNELSRLYLSTVETLAMAIDAKDQVTHGHIRRVQHYAIGLAKHLGVSDPTLIKAIEAASLLHDTGKLAVPEYILNKPGKLTHSEFEKMKAHASVGADILSAIDFPYPVVPIVRHHHENWDGTGYPDQLRGTDIPLGARILSVVDCFDALTSDRPYRPRLSDPEAIRILVDRRGSMYDPLIVDAFLTVYEELSSQHADGRDTVKQGLSAITRGVPPTRGPARDSDVNFGPLDGEELRIANALTEDLGKQLGFTSVATVLSRHLRLQLPETTCVLFVYDPIADELRARHADGSHAVQFRDVAIARGQGSVGWVAANLTTIVNSDPILDLGSTTSSHTPPLASSVSAVLVASERLVGVLSLYSTTHLAFTHSDRRIAELFAKLSSTAVAEALAFDDCRKSSLLTRAAPTVASYEIVQAFISAELAPGCSTRCVSMLLMEVTANPREPLPQQVMERTFQTVASELRPADVMFQCSDTELMVIVTGFDCELAHDTAKRISRRLQGAASTCDGSIAPVTVAVASAPDDGVTVLALVAAARLRAKTLEHPYKLPVQ